MPNEAQNPQINISKIQIGGGLAGVFVAAASMLIFLLGIPLLWYMFPAAVVLGAVVALVLHFARHATPGESWILSATKK